MTDTQSREPVASHALGRILKAALDHAPDALVITDAELDLPGPRIVFANRAFSRMTGYSPEEVLGRTPRLLQGPKTERTVLADLRARLAVGGTFLGEAWNYRKDGSPFLLQWHVSPIAFDGDAVVGFVAVQRDVTDLRVHSDPGADSGSFDQTACGVVHDLMNVILGMTLNADHLARRTDLSDPVRSGLEVIGQAGTEASDLARMLLHEREVAAQPVDLNEVARAAVAPLQTRLPREAIGLSTASDLPPILGHEEDIRRLPREQRALDSRWPRPRTAAG